jgi:serine/threonine protein kinase
MGGEINDRSREKLFEDADRLSRKNPNLADFGQLLRLGKAKESHRGALLKLLADPRLTQTDRERLELILMEVIRQIQTQVHDQAILTTRVDRDPEPTPSTKETESDQLIESINRTFINRQKKSTSMFTFRAERVLGAGGMGKIILGERIAEGEKTQVVFKLMHDQFDVGAREAFGKEIKALVGLKNTHIVCIQDAGVLDNDVPYLIMDFIEGIEGTEKAFDGTALLEIMQKNVERGRKIPAAAIMIICHAVALGLKETHAKSIAHQDIKPSNILLSSKAAQLLHRWSQWGTVDDQEKLSTHPGKGLNDQKLIDALYQLREDDDAIAYVTDFGLAKKFKNLKNAVHGASKNARTLPDLTRENFSSNTSLGGTPGYSPPETELIEGQGDLYALGVMICDFLKGFAEKKNAHEAAFAMAKKMLTGDSFISADDEALRAAPKDIRNLIEQLTNLKEPVDRGTVAEAIDRLGKAVLDNSPEGRSRQLWRWISAGFGGLAAVAALTAILLAGGKRPEAYTKYGLERNAIAAKMRNSLDDPKIGIEQLNKLLQELEQQKKAPAGYQPTDEEPTTAILDELKTKIEHAKKAQEDEAECRKCLEEGNRSYARGEVEAATKAFSRAKELGFPGMNAQAKRRIIQELKELPDWERKFNQLDDEVLDNLGWPHEGFGEKKNIQNIYLIGNGNWGEAVQRWLKDGLDDDPDSLTRFLMSLQRAHQSVMAVMPEKFDPNMPLDAIQQHAANRLGIMLTLFGGNGQAFVDRVKNGIVNPHTRSELQKCCQSAIITRLKRIQSFDLVPKMSAEAKLKERTVLIMEVLRSYVLLLQAVEGVGCTGNPKPEQLAQQIDNQLHLILPLLSEEERKAFREEAGKIPHLDQFPTTQQMIKRAG